jgi:hypothetical protein
MFSNQLQVELLNAFVVPEKDIEICLFTSIFGNFSVVVREGKEVKSNICVSQSQAQKLFEDCVKRTVNRFQLN